MHLSRCSAGNREVLAGEMNDASINGRTARDHAVCGKLLARHSEIDCAVLREQSDLLETLRIGQLQTTGH